jgi:hypothetical protein
MAIVAGFDAQSADHLRRARHRVGRAEPGSLSTRRRRPSRAGRSALRAASCMSRLARTGRLFVRDALAVTGGAASGRAGRDARVAQSQAPRTTDREDARWRRELLADGRLPEAWIPAEHVRQWRSRARLRHTAHRRAHPVDAAHPGDPVSPRRQRDPVEDAHPRGPSVPRRLGALAADARERIEIALAIIDAIEGQIAPLDVALRVELPGVDPATAEDLVAKAHAVCPYSNATRGNVDVELEVA